MPLLESKGRGVSLINFKQGKSFLRATLGEGPGRLRSVLFIGLLGTSYQEFIFTCDSAGRDLGRSSKEEAGVGSRPLQAAWLHKIDIKAAMILWSPLANLSAPE